MKGDEPAGARQEWLELLGLCSSLKFPASLPGPQPRRAKRSPHSGGPGQGELPSQAVPREGGSRLFQFPELARPLPAALGTVSAEERERPT